MLVVSLPLKNHCRECEDDRLHSLNLANARCWPEAAVRRVNISNNPGA